ncbi:hypothetical protein [Nonomuraea cavernae]|uniref:hypothetical protein n=1 Tax=Nonomuraea cavernae TaxID=2045107 RepID=UPI0033C0B524
MFVMSKSRDSNFLKVIQHIEKALNPKANAGTFPPKRAGHNWNVHYSLPFYSGRYKQRHTSLVMPLVVDSFAGVAEDSKNPKKNDIEAAIAYCGCSGVTADNPHRETLRSIAIISNVGRKWL